MNRVRALEKARAERRKVPVLIVRLTAAGEYVYNGVLYSEKEFDAFVERVRPGVIILDNIPK